MPKLVDAEERRKLVAEAIFTVVVRDGLAHASLRNIATETGLAVGSVRHYFTDTAEMIQFALGELIDRISARIRVHADRALAATDPTERHEHATALLCELLPIDEQRHTECTVWLAFATAARTTPELRPRIRELYDGTRWLIGRVLTHRIRDGADVELEAERLTALLDGLMTNGVIQPDRMTPDLMRRVLDAHLDSVVRF